MHRVSGKLSSAQLATWGETPKDVYVNGLYGCTSVVIISHGGVWMSHYWEVGLPRCVKSQPS